MELSSHEIGQVKYDPGSFRDPAGKIIYFENRIFRSVQKNGKPGVDQLFGSGLLGKLTGSGRLIPTQLLKTTNVPPEVFEHCDTPPLWFLEHEKIDYISYPYEWPFSLLKKAAIHHIDLHLEALQHSMTLIDASGFNIQFMGVSPIFIDILSLQPYRDGEYWLGYRQFCEHFVNPLLLTAKKGVPFHHWYRASMDGVSVSDLSRLLPINSYLSWNTLIHVFFHAWLIRFQGKKRNSVNKKNSDVFQKGLPKRSLVGMLLGLRSWIEYLEPNCFRKTTWSSYEKDNSYVSNEHDSKRRCVKKFVSETKPKLLFDFGCNSGEYSHLALEHPSCQDCCRILTTMIGDRNGEKILARV